MFQAIQGTQAENYCIQHQNCSELIMGCPKLHCHMLDHLYRIPAVQQNVCTFKGCLWHLWWQPLYCFQFTIPSYGFMLHFQWYIYKALEPVWMMWLWPQQFLSSFLDFFFRLEHSLGVRTKEKQLLPTIKVSLVSYVSITTYDVIETWLNIALCCIAGTCTVAISLFLCLSPRVISCIYTPVPLVWKSIAR